MGPRSPVPPASRVEPPQSWRGGAPRQDLTNGVVTTIDARWWREFGDPTLVRLVESALERNDDQRIAIARVAEARAAVKLARGALLPSADAQVSGAREAGVSPFGTANQQSAGELTASVAYDTDIFGRLRNESAAAVARLLESAAARDTVTLAVASATASSYITIRALDARLEIVQSTLALRAESLHIAQRRYAVGYSTALDLEQAKAEYLSAQRLVPELHLALVKQENALSALLSNVPGAIPRGEKLEELRLPTLPDALPAAVVRQRPDIYAAEQHLVAADRTLSAARAAFLPNIVLEAGAGRAFSTLYPTPITLWSVGGSVLAPLFEGGALRAQRDIAASRRDQAAFAYRRTVLTAFHEVEDQLTAIRETDAQIQTLTAQKEALAAASQLATRRYRAGYSSYLNQLDAERGLLNAQLGLVQIKAYQLLAFVDLFRAIGGGWHPPHADTDVNP
jgi:multidrug efflux system outer membrane protein